MATTTTNFGWDIPQSTDLVKDGATAIATLGQDIDTALVDLKGGTTGQILAKNSNTDLDYTWINNDQGDITAVTAGTGLTGGGTTGAVTLTNDMATTITASGDIVVGTGSGTYDNLPIGTSGQVLTADTSVSPYKVKWAAIPSSAPAFSGALITNDAQQTISNNTDTYLTYNTETYDTDGYHSTSSNTGRLTIPTGKDGYYYIYTLVRWNNSTAGQRTMQITKNAAQDSMGVIEATPGGVNAYIGHHFGTIRYAVAGDYFECKVNQTSGGNLAVRSGSAECAFGIQYVGA